MQEGIFGVTSGNDIGDPDGRTIPSGVVCADEHIIVSVIVDIVDIVDIACACSPHRQASASARVVGGCPSRSR